jgi:hypothetical protein
LPIKGCITSGNISYDRDNQDIVIAGTPIVEAYKFEQSQNWIGVMISPNTLREYPDILAKCTIGNIQIAERLQNLKTNIAWSLCAQRTYLIPMKSSDGDENMEGLALVPHQSSSNDAAHIIEDLKIYENHLAEQKLYSTEPSIRQKYINTGQFIKAIAKDWKDLWSNSHYRNEFWINSSNKPNVISLAPPDRIT